MAKHKRITDEDLMMLAEYDFAHPDTSAVQAGKDLDYHRDTISDMRKKDLYKQHLTKLLHDEFYSLRQMAIRVMRDKLLDGNIKAAEYILDNTGFKEADKVEVTNNEIVVTIE